MNYLIAIVGPTAIGKSDLALNLAEKMNGEIINSDSRQIYRFMSIGTAKPPPEDLRRVPHHLIDIVNPDEDYSLSIYQESANKIIEDTFKRSKVPFLVGGTGQYVWSVIEGWQVPEVKPDYEFRKQLEERVAKEGWECLFEELQRVDPLAAQTIMPTNVRRVIRALEIYKHSHKPASRLWRKKGTSFKSIIIGLTMERKALYEKIDGRVDRMIGAGLVDEVRRLLTMGYSIDLPAMSGIGYRQAAMYIEGKLPLDEAIAQIKTETHRFARRQYTWFKLTDQRINWFDVNNDIKDNIYNFIGEAIRKLGEKKK
jgi:tRNA dimethylallyltransferase